MLKDGKLVSTFRKKVGGVALFYRKGQHGVKKHNPDGLEGRIFKEGGKSAGGLGGLTIGRERHFSLWYPLQHEKKKS